MPFINMYVRQGLTSVQTRQLAGEVTSAIANTLENTLPRMVRISIYEIPAHYMRDGAEQPKTPAPTLVLQLGPGRSDEAIDRCLDAVVDAVHWTLAVPKESIRFYVERVPGENFAIGGKLKDFQKKVN